MYPKCLKLLADLEVHRLGADHHLVATMLECRADQFLGAAIAGGSVVERDAPVIGGMKGIQAGVVVGRSPVRATDSPSAKADLAHADACKVAVVHVCPANGLR